MNQTLPVSSCTRTRRLPCGAEVLPTGVHFRVWAPKASLVEVQFDDPALSPLRLEPEKGGYFSGVDPRVRVNARYRYRLDGAESYPDPWSRFQPDGPHGPSMVVDPGTFAWQVEEWPGIVMKGQVIYELHVGAFTPEGTFDAAARQLAELRKLGITCIEILPLAEFPGAFNWGYDGVALFAPYHGYGDAHALRRFVDAAHEEGLAVILDVVYNHLGPDGNYLTKFTDTFFTKRYENDWGESINFDGPGSGPVRDFYIANAGYWIGEFRLDGLRLDATQNINDSSEPHVLSEIVRRARAAAGTRRIIVVAENEPQRGEYLTAASHGGIGLDAMWNDDFHHSARVALTGSHDGYFHDYRGRAQEFVSAVKHGFLFQGQHYFWQKQGRGSPSPGAPAWAFIAFTQNHDQVANSFYGMRLPQLTSSGLNRAMTALLLLGPHTPMLFMGQEFGASTPFAFFADHREPLAQAVRKGRGEFMSQFRHYATPEAQARLLDPASVDTFCRSKLDFAERKSNARTYALHRDLLQIRRDDPVIAKQDRLNLDGAVLGERAFLLRWFDEQYGDRLLVVNLDHELQLCPAPEPLLAPPREARWQMIWSSDDPRYGGTGVVDACGPKGWSLPAQSAILFGVEPDAR